MTTYYQGCGAEGGSSHAAGGTDAYRIAGVAAVDLKLHGSDRRAGLRSRCADGGRERDALAEHRRAHRGDHGRGGVGCRSCARRFAEDPDPLDKANASVRGDNALTPRLGIDRVDPPGCRSTADGTHEDPAVYAQVEAVQAGVVAERGNHSLGARLRVDPDHAAGIAIGSASRVAHDQIPVRLDGDILWMVEKSAMDKAR